MIRPWRVPNIWPGERCFILGGGPSLNLIDMDKLRDLPGRRVIAVNCSYRVAPWADVCFYHDSHWLGIRTDGVSNRERLLQFAGLKVTTCAAHEKEPGILRVGIRTAPKGIVWDPYVVAWNCSSGACAVNLAVHFGVREIVLLGFDMHRGSSGENNFHDWYPAPKGQSNPYRHFLQAFPHIARDLASRRISVLNACPGSAITCWPIVDPADLGIARSVGADPPEVSAADSSEAMGDDFQEPLSARETAAERFAEAIPAPRTDPSRDLAPERHPRIRSILKRRVPRGTRIVGKRICAVPDARCAAVPA